MYYCRRQSKLAEYPSKCLTVSDSQVGRPGLPVKVISILLPKVVYVGRLPIKRLTALDSLSWQARTIQVYNCRRQSKLADYPSKCLTVSDSQVGWPGLPVKVHYCRRQSKLAGYLSKCLTASGSLSWQARTIQVFYCCRQSKLADYPSKCLTVSDSQVGRPGLPVKVYHFRRQSK